MQTARVWMVGALVTLAACGGGGDGGGGTEPAVFTSLTIAPNNPTVLVGATTTLTTTARDQNSQQMSGATVTYASANQAVATVTNAGVVTGVSAGTAQVTATGQIGTVTKTATVTVTVTVPGATASVAATAGNSFDPANVTITKGGTVTWTFAALHNVTFDVAGAPPGTGNVSSGNASVTFPNAGSYPYHCTIHGTGMSGTVVVQ
jgi:plastocyanin